MSKIVHGSTYYISRKQSKLRTILPEINEPNTEENYGLPKSYLTKERATAQLEYDIAVKNLDNSDDKKAMWVIIATITLSLLLGLYSFLYHHHVFNAPIGTYSDDTKGRVLLQTAIAASMAIFIVIGGYSIYESLDSRRLINPKKEALGRRPNSFNYLVDPFERVEGIQIEKIDQTTQRATVGSYSFDIVQVKKTAEIIDIEIQNLKGRQEDRCVSHRGYPIEADGNLVAERAIREILNRISSKS